MGLLLTNEDLQYILENLSVKPVAVVQAGSSTLPIIEEPKDTDYVFMFDLDLESARKIRKQIDDLKKELLQQDSCKYTWRDLGFITKANPKYWLNPMPRCGDTLWPDDPDYIIPNAVFEHYWIYRYGKPLNLCDVLGKDHNKYVKSLWLSYQFLKEKLRKEFMPKYWYYLYLGCCIIKNNSYDNFTEEQIRDINILHDCKDLFAHINTVAKIKSLVEEVCKDVIETQTTN